MSVVRVYIIDGEVKEQVLVRNFEVVGTYPPEGAAFEWGFLVRLNGIEHKMPSRAGATEETLHQYFREKSLRHDRAKLKDLARFFDWIT